MQEVQVRAGLWGHKTLPLESPAQKLNLGTMELVSLTPDHPPVGAAVTLVPSEEAEARRLSSLARTLRPLHCDSEGRLCP